jgi:hypothetical protein
MTYRREDETAIMWLRNLQARIERLEKSDKGVRQNDIRLGDMVVTTDAGTDEICIENLITGDVVCLGQPNTEVIFSYPDEVNTAGQVSGAYKVREGCIATEIVVSVQTADTSPIQVTVFFGTIASRVVTLPAGETEVTLTLNQTCPAGLRVYIEMTDVGDSTATDLVAIVRFD